MSAEDDLDREAVEAEPGERAAHTRDSDRGQTRQRGVVREIAERGAGVGHVAVRRARTRVPAAGGPIGLAHSRLPVLDRRRRRSVSYGFALGARAARLIDRTPPAG